MTITLKIIFYVCCIWLTLFILSTVFIMAVIGIEYGRVLNDKYFDNWFTYFAFAFVVVRLIGIWVRAGRKVSVETKR